MGWEKNHKGRKEMNLRVWKIAKQSANEMEEIVEKINL